LKTGALDQNSPHPVQQHHTGKRQIQAALAGHAAPLSAAGGLQFITFIPPGRRPLRAGGRKVMKRKNPKNPACPMK